MTPDRYTEEADRLMTADTYDEARNQVAERLRVLTGGLMKAVAVLDETEISAAHYMEAIHALTGN